MPLYFKQQPFNNTHPLTGSNKYPKMSSPPPLLKVFLLLRGKQIVLSFCVRKHLLRNHRYLHECGRTDGEYKCGRARLRGDPSTPNRPQCGFTDFDSAIFATRHQSQPPEWAPASRDTVPHGNQARRSRVTDLLIFAPYGAKSQVRAPVKVL